MKKLKPSHREKKRYLLIQGKDADKKNIDETILKYVGILGYSRASPYMIRKGNKAILAINRKSLDEIRASFLLSGKKITIVKVSGSLKRLR